MEEDMMLPPVSFDSCFDFCTTTDSDEDDEARLNKLLMPFMKLRFSVSLLSEGDFSSGFDSVIRMELLADVLLSLFSLSITNTKVLNKKSKPQEIVKSACCH